MYFTKLPCNVHALFVIYGITAPAEPGRSPVLVFSTAVSHFPDKKVDFMWLLTVSGQKHVTGNPDPKKRTKSRPWGARIRKFGQKPPKTAKIGADKNRQKRSILYPTSIGIFRGPTLTQLQPDSNFSRLKSDECSRVGRVGSRGRLS